MKNKEDSFEIIGKTIIFTEDTTEYIIHDDDEFGYGIDCPIGFKAKVISCEYFTKECVQFELDFSEFLEENLKLLKPTWSDIIDGKEVNNLKWNECPSFWSEENQITYYSWDIFNLPFVSLN